MAPSGYVCYGFERVRMWAVGRKSVNLSEQIENKYLSGARSGLGYSGVFGGVSGVFSPPQAAQFFESRFYPLSGRREAK